MPREQIISAIHDLQNPAAAKPLEKEKPEDKQIAIRPAPKAIVEKEVNVDATPLLVTLNYPKRQTRLDAGADKNLKDFLNVSKDILNARQIKIHAFAPASAGSLTEARRIAYYRAMLIRLRLIAEGINQEKIHLQVDDQFSDADGDKVKIFTR